MDHSVISVIGAGNMGSSLIGGLIKHGHPSIALFAADPSEDKLHALKQAFHIQTTTDNQVAAAKASVLLLAVKPASCREVAIALASHLTQKSLIISIVAGIREQSLQQWLGGEHAIVRAMPNTPALIGCGATGLFANSYVSTEQKSLAESILRAVGITVWLEDETLLDAVTALSGSGPAYFFHMMEALQKAGEELGLSAEIARLLTLQTALGAARMAMESGTSLTMLRQHVTSPGGTTEKAISVLDEHQLHELYKKALKAAKMHATTLANQLGETP